MASVSWWWVKINRDLICTNSLPRGLLMNTMPSPLVRETKAQKPTLKNISKNSQSVSITQLLYSQKPLISCAGSLEELIKHGLHALRETLQQDKELTIHNTSIGIIGPAGEHEQGVRGESFRILEGEVIDIYLQSMVAKETDAPAAPATQGGDEDVQME